MNRIKKLAQKLEGPCLIENPADLLYLTGLTLSKGRLLVSGEEATLFVDGRYFDRAKKEAPAKVLLWEEQKKITEKSISFDSAFVTYDGYLSLKNFLPHVHWVPLPNPVKHSRAIKEPNEIAALRKA